MNNMIAIITFLFNPIDINCCMINCLTWGSFLISVNALLVAKKTVINHDFAYITIYFYKLTYFINQF